MYTQLFFYALHSIALHDACLSIQLSFLMPNPQDLIPRRTIPTTAFLHVLTILTLCQLATAFQFYLQAGEHRCFTESAAPNSKVLAEYTVSTGKGTMPVDILVRMPGHSDTLYSRQNVDHGKFAFVVPFDPEKSPHIHQAEMHRKMTEQIHRMARTDVHGGAGGEHREEGANVHHGRKLLSSEEKAHAQQQPPQPPGGHGEDHDHAGHAHEEGGHSHYRHRHHYYRDGHEHHHHEEADDDDDYDYEDELDDFEMDNYDGIGDEDLDEEFERNAREEEKLHGRFEDASDEEKEDRLFEFRSFEICVISRGEKTGHKRRVRLVLNKGDTAHDYTRLAKKEHLTQLEVSLRQVSAELHELMHELDQARAMEDILRERNENTNKRVVILSMISLFCLFAVGSYQALYTKKFFKRKKIL